MKNWIWLVLLGVVGLVVYKHYKPTITTAGQINDVLTGLGINTGGTSTGSTASGSYWDSLKGAFTGIEGALSTGI